MDSLRSLIGQELQGAHYLLPAGMDTSSLDLSGDIHEVDHGVQLVTSHHSTMTLMWQMSNECSELLIVDGESGEDEGITQLVASYEVTDVPAWSPLKGRRITGVSVAIEKSELNCPETILACRVELEGDYSFVVALAEVRNGKLKFQPDNIAVIFDRRIAESLRYGNGNVSAWAPI